MRVDAHTESKRTPQSTQVRGPREEVKPLLMPLSLCLSGSGRVLKVLGRVTKVLLELFSGF